MSPVASRIPLIFVLVCLLLIGSSGVAVFAQNGCTPGPTGNNADNTITCEGTVSSQVDGNGGNDYISLNGGTVTGNRDVEGDAGNDTIHIFGVVTGNVEGGTGDDYLHVGNGSRVNGKVTGNDGNDEIQIDNRVNGDIEGGNGDDLIVTSGTTWGNIEGGEGGDTIHVTGPAVVSGNVEVQGGGGNDTIRIEGTVIGDVRGNNGTDSIRIEAGAVVNDVTDGGNGNDTIVIDGTAHLVQGGNNNDIIVVNGTVTARVDAEGQDDTVILQDGANGGTDHTLNIDGGTYRDTLRFEMTMNSEADYQAAAAVIARNQRNGSITINGETFVWTNFEQLVNALTVAAPPGSTLLVMTTATDSGGTRGGGVYSPTMNDGRLNMADYGFASIALYCVNGTLQVYNTTGQMLIQADAPLVKEQLAKAIGSQQNQNLGITGSVSLWALYSDAFQVQDDATGYMFVALSSACP